MSIIDLLPWLGSLLSIGITVGGLVVALRSGFSKGASEIQERVIAGLKDRVTLLDQKVEDLEEDRKRQNSVISTIRYALKQRGLKIVIEGEFVTLSESGKNSKVVRIQDRATIEDDETDVS